MNEYRYQLPLYHQSLVEMQLNRLPMTPKLSMSSKDDSNTDGSSLVSSSEDDCNTMEFALVLDLVPYGWTCLGVVIPLMGFLTSKVGSLVSGAGLDGISLPCDLWRVKQLPSVYCMHRTLTTKWFWWYTHWGPGASIPWQTVHFCNYLESYYDLLDGQVVTPNYLLGISRAFPPVQETDFCALVFILFNAHLFTARMSSCCWLTQAHLLWKMLSL